MKCIAKYFTSCGKMILKPETIAKND